MAQGRKTGGRKKGVPNKRTIQFHHRVAEHGITPLEYMLQVLPRAESVRPDDLRFLFTTIPQLKYDAARGLPPSMLKNLITARGKDDVKGYQKQFRERVDEYLKQLKTADEPERKIIQAEFKENAETDLNQLRKEMKLAGMGTLVVKDGIVGALLGAGLAAVGAPPSLATGIGAIAGVSGALFRYEEQRAKALASHWTSWAMCSSNERFTLW